MPTTQHPSNLLYLIALTNIKLIGPVIAKELISHCGGIQEVFKANKSKLKRVPKVGEKIASNILNGRNFDEAQKELAFIEKNNIQVHTYLDDTYPKRLTHYDDSPLLLYQKGKAKLNPPRTVAIVGTRKATARGIAICEEIVEGLQPYHVSIISGLAYGIDIAAHRKCVALNIPTIGVLGHGLDRIYPAVHRKTAEQMLEHGGLLTEFPSGTQPMKDNFPSRNRIIAGLCDAVIVVETKVTGGSVITAHFANAYHKDVFAVPGRLTDEHSAGCNHLIKSHKAALLQSAEDIGYIMRWEKTDDTKNPKAIQRELFHNLTNTEKAIVELLRSDDQMSIDQLTFQLKQSTSQVATLLLEMEFKGIVKTLPGSRYTLVK